MASESSAIPVALFAYARPKHLAQVLASLRANEVPLLYAFADGAKDPSRRDDVEKVRSMLRGIDWCEVRLVERVENLGLGRNLRAGVGEVLGAHGVCVVWEDDLIAIRGTYGWLCGALEHYRENPRVMSVTAWTHPRITPVGLHGRPYFDARAECWVWGTWARAWAGLDTEDACAKMAAAEKRGIAPDAYGADLPKQARSEHRRSTWAVRWLYHHFQHGGLCLRPPSSLVEHIGFDAAATNAAGAADWANPPLRAAPPPLLPWPEPEENPACRQLWAVAGDPPRQGLAATLKRAARRVVPSALLDPVVNRFFRVHWDGSHRDWASARAACRGYAEERILQQVRAAARLVRDKRAAYERDGIVFQQPPPPWPGTDVLRDAADRDGALTVLDFGGSLGSVYFQVRPQLTNCRTVRWRIVEQPGFVAVGREEFQNDELEFHSSAAEACASGAPDVLLLASVLPYLPSPMETLRELLRAKPAWIIVDRTAFTTHAPTQLKIQRVPRSIYSASYPCWFLNRAEFLAAFGPEYSLIADYPEDVVVPDGLEFRSLHFSRRTA